MSEEEQKVVRRRIPRRDFWKRNRIVGHTEVVSGPLPSPEELPPQEEPEQAPNPPSPMYPKEGAIRRDVPMGGVPAGEDKD